MSRLTEWRTLFLASILMVLNLACGGDAPVPATDEPAATDETRSRQSIRRINRDGTSEGAIGEPQEVLSGVEVSPNGTQVVVRGRENGSDDIFIHDVEGASMRRLTSDPAHARHPQWSPDGNRIAFFSYRNGPTDIFVRAADGSGDEIAFASGPMHEYYPDWSPDGAFVVYHRHDTETDLRDIWFVEVEDDNSAQPLVESDYNKSLPRFSPDGRFVAYQADASGSGDWNIYIASFPDGAITQVTTGGGVWPKWNRAGGELFYFAGDTLMSIAVSAAAALELSEPTPLFTTEALGGWKAEEASLFNPLYSPGPDGTWFALVSHNE